MQRSVQNYRKCGCDDRKEQRNGHSPNCGCDDHKERRNGHSPNCGCDDRKEQRNGHNPNCGCNDRKEQRNSHNPNCGCDDHQCNNDSTAKCPGGNTPVPCSGSGKGPNNEPCCRPNKLYLGNIEANAEYTMCTDRYDYKICQPKWQVGTKTPYTSFEAIERRQGLYNPVRYQPLYKQEITVSRQLRNPDFTYNLEVIALNGETFLPQIRADNDSFKNGTEEVWLYDNRLRNQMPIRVGSFSEDGTIAYMIVNPINANFREDRGQTFTATIMRVKLDRYFYQTWVGGMDNHGQAVIKSRVAPYQLLKGSPGVYLRMAYLNEISGKWVEFYPEMQSGFVNNVNPQVPTAEDGMLQWIVKGLKPGCRYSAIVGEFYGEWTRGNPGEITGAGSAFRFFEEQVDGFTTNSPMFINGNRFDASLYSTRFRMPPNKCTSEKIRFAAFTCNTGGPINDTFKNSEKEYYDFFLELGDTIYGDTADGGRDVDPDPVLQNKQYKEIWSALWRVDNYVGLRTSCGSYGVPDDHEVTNGWQNFNAQQLANGDPNPLFLLTPDERTANDAVRDNLASVLNEYTFSLTFPLPSFRITPDSRIFTAYDNYYKYSNHRVPNAIKANKSDFIVHWGNAVDLIVVDHMPRVNLVDKTIVYPQRDFKYWFDNAVTLVKKALLESKALVKVIAHSGIFLRDVGDENDQYEELYVSKAVELGYDAKVSRSAFKKNRAVSRGDSDGYYNQMPQLMDFILENDIKNVVFISGGSHLCVTKYYDQSRCILEVQASSTGNDNLNNLSTFAAYPGENQLYVGVNRDNNYSDFEVDPDNKLFTIRSLYNGEAFFTQNFQLK